MPIQSAVCATRCLDGVEADAHDRAMVLSSEPAHDGIDEPDLSALVTEDDTPVDSIYSEKQQRLLTGPLFGEW